MPIIYTYPDKSAVVAQDELILSDSEVVDPKFKTKNVTVANLVDARIKPNQIKYDLNATQDGLNVDLNLTSSDGTDDSVVQFTAGSNITLTRNSATEITIAASGGGGGGTPGGSDTQIQYNDGGSFGGTTGLTWNDSTNILSIATRYEGDIDGAVLQQVIANEALSKGDVVYISGGLGDNPEVRKAQANSASTMAALGIMKDNTNLNDVGECVTSGEITGLNLTGFTTGDELFVSNTTAGGLLTSAPTGEANLIQKIGKVIKGGAGGALTVLGAFRANATPNLNQGSIFIGSGANESTTLAIGSNTHVLTSNGTTASWQAVPATGVTDFTNSNGTFVSFGTTNTNATGAVTVGSVDLSATGSPSASTFLRGDNTWATPTDTNTTYSYNVPSGTTTLRLAESTGTDYDVALVGGTNVTITRNSANQLTFASPDTNTTYTLQADAKVGTSVPLKLDASTGTDSTVNLTEGANVTLTRNSANQITIAAAGGGGSSKLGFTPLTIYEATRGISSGTTGKTIYRQSVVETDCTIDKVDFFVTAVTGLSNVLTVAVYVGNLTTATRVLLGTSSALSTGMNTITFTASHTFSAGDDIVIYTSQNGSEEENNTIAGNAGLLNNSLLSRGDASYSATPSTSISPPEASSNEGLALHFYDE